MSTFISRPKASIPAHPAQATAPRRLLVTAGVVIFAVRDWSLWVLLRDGPWGPPMRLVLSTESVSDAVDRTLEALLMWPAEVAHLQLKAGWQEQQVCVWGSTEQGMAVSLVHGLLLRANRDQLRPNLHLKPVPTLHVKWVPVAEIESGQRNIDPDVRPAVLDALGMLRLQVQRDPALVLSYLADMDTMRPIALDEPDWWHNQSRETQPLSALKEPERGDNTITLAEAAMLYRALLPSEEQVDLSNLRRRFLATNMLQALDGERPVRGRELDWRRISRVYRYLG